MNYGTCCRACEHNTANNKRTKAETARVFFFSFTAGSRYDCTAPPTSSRSRNKIYLQMLFQACNQNDKVGEDALVPLDVPDDLRRQLCARRWLPLNAEYRRDASQAQL